MTSVFFLSGSQFQLLHPVGADGRSGIRVRTVSVGAAQVDVIGVKVRVVVEGNAVAYIAALLHPPQLKKP